MFQIIFSIYHYWHIILYCSLLYYHMLSDYIMKGNLENIDTASLFGIHIIISFIFISSTLFPNRINRIVKSLIDLEDFNIFRRENKIRQEYSLLGLDSDIKDIRQNHYTYIIYCFAIDLWFVFSLLYYRESIGICSLDSQHIIFIAILYTAINTYATIYIINNIKKIISKYTVDNTN